MSLKIEIMLSDVKGMSKRMQKDKKKVKKYLRTKYKCTSYMANRTIELLEL